MCTTTALTKNYSGCLEDNPDCAYARAVGFSFHCTHPEHKQFSACVEGRAIKGELAARYEKLREARRIAFINSLGDTEKALFADTYLQHKANTCQ